MDIEESGSATQRHLLGQFGRTLAAAVGWMLVPGPGMVGAERRSGRNGGELQTVSWWCCVDCFTCPCSGMCKSNRVRYFCKHQSVGCSDFCTGRKMFSTNCYLFTSQGEVVPGSVEVRRWSPT